MLFLLLALSLGARRVSGRNRPRVTTRATQRRRNELTGNLKKVIMPGIGISRAQAEALFDAQMQFSNFRMQQLFQRFLPEVLNEFYGSLPEEMQSIPFNAPYMMPVVGAPQGHPQGHVAARLRGHVKQQ